MTTEQSKNRINLKIAEYAVATGSGHTVVTVTDRESTREHSCDACRPGDVTRTLLAAREVRKCREYVA